MKRYQKGQSLKKTCKKLLPAALSVIIAFLMTACGKDNRLRFNSDGKFRIVIFSDTQDQYEVHSRLTDIMCQALDREKPDLVVFTGDQTELNANTVDDTRRTLEQILQPVVERELPYAFMFGNHDDQIADGSTVTKDDIFAVYQSIGDCRTTDPEPSMTGVGTCNIPIYASRGKKLAFNLWMLDSNTYLDPVKREGGYDNPHMDQLIWMQKTQTALTEKAGYVVPSFVFQHIPMPEIYELLVKDPNGTERYGAKYALQLNENASGYLGEFPCPSSENTGELAVLKQIGGVLCAFTGHDHLNDFTGTYDGITMTAVPGMTYFNYGDEAARGYGVIELNEDDLNNYEYHSVKFTTLDEEKLAKVPTDD